MKTTNNNVCVTDDNEHADECNILQCEIYQALEQIKGRWTPVIVFSLENGAKKYGQIADEFMLLSSTQLTRSLKTLLNHRLISKEGQSYQLTAKGQALVPILHQLEAWQNAH